ncbi:Nif11 family protein [Thiorhodovibrio frisius]|uniref:Uncharacterized protein n=1 Tax=Thiorhodovibrio frisius TaxID=631362 RepID=H8Z1M0_9GAMM|nr:Nif11 family protein [Thiorhodovibrio frisius]EIC21465.1 hypothetical protein Thi970DRAFT_01675 [Thiorhodovibrio frisius]WPL24051.1 nif11-like leader peptide domain protein [Thiorhodovibrio frisius]
MASELRYQLATESIKLKIEGGLMANPSVGAFYEAVVKDETKKEQLIKLGEAHSPREMDKQQILDFLDKHMVPLAKEMGFEITANDIFSFSYELPKESDSGKLSKEELDAVAGGASIYVGSFCLGIGATFIAAGSKLCFGFGT